jgi:hypothetical protein
MRSVSALWIAVAVLVAACAGHALAVLTYAQLRAAFPTAIANGSPVLATVLTTA